MNELTTLLDQRAALEQQIAAQKPAAVAQVIALMQSLGLTWEDFGVVPRGAPARKSALPAKYADGKGNTWTGVGQRPRWLKAALAAGGDVEQFRVRKA